MAGWRQVPRHSFGLYAAWRQPALPLAGVSRLCFSRFRMGLARNGAGMIFVCDFERPSFASKIGLGGKPNTVVYNGLWPDEFKAVKPDEDATDVLFMGDMRHLKGVDVLLKALALVQRKRPLTACLVGDGPDSAEFKNLAERLGLGTLVTFPGRLPTAQALKRGNLLILPSRAESFPYVVLEAAAGQVPTIATDVGGISEILPQNLAHLTIRMLWRGTLKWPWQFRRRLLTTQRHWLIPPEPHLMLAQWAEHNHFLSAPLTQTENGSDIRC